MQGSVERTVPELKHRSPIGDDGHQPGRPVPPAPPSPPPAPSPRRDRLAIRVFGGAQPRIGGGPRTGQGDQRRARDRGQDGAAGSVHRCSQCFSQGRHGAGGAEGEDADVGKPVRPRLRVNRLDGNAERLGDVLLVLLVGRDTGFPLSDALFVNAGPISPAFSRGANRAGEVDTGHRPRGPCQRQRMGVVRHSTIQSAVLERSVATARSCSRRGAGGPLLRKRHMERKEGMPWSPVPGQNRPLRTTSQRVFSTENRAWWTAWRQQ